MITAIPTRESAPTNNPNPTFSMSLALSMSVRSSDAMDSAGVIILSGSADFFRNTPHFDCGELRKGLRVGYVRGHGKGLGAQAHDTIQPGSPNGAPFGSISRTNTSVATSVLASWLLICASTRQWVVLETALAASRR